MKWSAMGVAAMAALIAGVAVGQDAATTKKKAAPNLSAAAQKMSDPDARWAIEQVERARSHARCLKTAASKVERLARQVEAAHSDAKKIAGLMALMNAQDELEDCNAKKKSLRGDQRGDGIKFGPMSISTPVCEPSDPLCSDIVSPSSAPVVDTVKNKRGGFRLCYAKAQRSNPKLKGRMSIRAMLAPTADLKSSVASTIEIEQDTMKNPELATCVTRNIQSLRFDPGGAGKIVRFELMMSPGE